MFKPTAEHMARAQLDIFVNTAAARYTGDDLENYVKSMYYCLQRVVELGEACNWGRDLNELLLEASKYIVKGGKPKQINTPDRKLIEE